MTGAAGDTRAIVDRLLEALNTIDVQALSALVTEDLVVEYPQSGEIIRGRRNNVEVFRNYPGRDAGAPKPEVETAQVLGGDQWVLTPAFALIRLEGSGNTRTAIFRVRYPDGSVWWAVNFLEFRSGLIARWVTYFAPVFDPPAWRAPWVERPS